MKTISRLLFLILTFTAMTATCYAADEGALFAAIKAWDDMAVETLLANGADVNARNEYGETPLHMAAFSGDIYIAELLIAKGADVHATTTSGQFTTLYYAVDSGSNDIAELLLSRGVDVNARSVDGKSPMDMVTERLNNWNEMAGILKAYMK